MPATPLTVHNAEIRTATVEIKTLTVSGKQVTLAVFRQLREEPLIADDGTFNGQPWGIVNYHPFKWCDDEGRHYHVVWQKGSDLRRATVKKPVFFDDCVHAEHGAQWLDSAVLDGWRPTCDEPTNRNVHYMQLVFPAGQARVGADNVVIDAIWPSALYYIAGEDREVRIQRRQQEALDKLKARSSGTSTAELHELVSAEVAAELARRQRHFDCVAQVLALPQLFIAV